MYRSEVHYEFIARAVAALPCPVLANGNVYSAQKAAEVLKITGARGLMIGRGVIRNPWLFRQIREHQRGEALFVPRGRDVLAYVRALYEAVCSPAVRESAQVQKMKKYMNYLGVGVEPPGNSCTRFAASRPPPTSSASARSSWTTTEPMPLEPFRGVRLTEHEMCMAGRINS